MLCEHKDLLNIEQLFINENKNGSLYNIAETTNGGGSNVLRIPIILIDMKGREIKRYESISEMSRIHGKHFGTKRVNTNAVFCRKYRVVTESFYKSEIISVLNWNKETKNKRGVIKQCRYVWQKKKMRQHW